MNERIDYSNLSATDVRLTDFDSREQADTDGIKINIDTLIQLTERHPVTQISLDEVTDQLEYPCWTDANGARVTPEEIIDLILQEGYESAAYNHSPLEKHIHSIQTADRSYPVHMYEGNIINGMHRLAQVYIDRETGVTEQNFLTVKNLSHIPKEALLTDENYTD